MAHLGDHLLDEIDSILQFDGASQIHLRPKSPQHRRYASAESNFSSAATSHVTSTPQLPNHSTTREIYVHGNGSSGGDIDVLDSILADLDAGPPHPVSPTHRDNLGLMRIRSSPSAPSLQDLDKTLFIPSPPSGKSKHIRPHLVATHSSSSIPATPVSATSAPANFSKKCFRPLLGTTREKFGYMNITDERYLSALLVYLRSAACSRLSFSLRQMLR
jgi:hypothetical protein